jgi:CPA2 family monovalent cation:H+ antiporter-2
VINGSDLSHEAATEALPLQDAFSVLFFVAVGMLFDPSILLRQPVQVVEVVLIIILGKSIAALVIVLAFRRPVNTALTIAASLAQIGEFSFILAALAVGLGIIPKEGESLVVAGAIISISLNPLAFALSTRAARWIDAHRRTPAAAPAETTEPGLRDHVVVVGYGRVGSAIGEALKQQAVPFVVIEQNRELVEAQQAAAVPIFAGDAADPADLRQAGVDRARLLVLATPDPYQSLAIHQRARELNPKIETVARSHGEAEQIYLESHGLTLALVSERELALALARYALTKMGCSEDKATATIQALRRPAR